MKRLWLLLLLMILVGRCATTRYGPAEEFMEKKQYDQAIYYYNRALKINPRYEIAWCNKGYALSAMQKYRQAIKCFNKAIKLFINQVLKYSLFNI